MSAFCIMIVPYRLCASVGCILCTLVKYSCLDVHRVSDTLLHLGLSQLQDIHCVAAEFALQDHFPSCDLLSTAYCVWQLNIRRVAAVSYFSMMLHLKLSCILQLLSRWQISSLVV